MLHTAGFYGPRSLFFAAGSFGVCVFFLLSAYLITTLLLLEKEWTGTIHVRAFYLRRALRIWPLYYMCLLLCLLLDPHLPFGHRIPHAGATFALLLGNWSLVRHGWSTSPLDPLWTVSAEEQFYLLVPLLAGWGGRRALTVCAVAAIALSSMLSVPLSPATDPLDPRVWCNSFFQFQFFAAGVLMALYLRRIPVRLPRLMQSLCLAGVVLAWWAAMHGTTRVGVIATLMASTRWLLVLLGCVLLLLTALSVSRVPRWLAYLGKISYGLYLFHAFFLYLIYGRWQMRLYGLGPGRPVLGFALTVAAAALSYHFFERRFLLLKRRFTFVPSRPA